MFKRYFGFLIVFMAILSLIGCETKKDLSLNLEMQYKINNKLAAVALDSILIPSQFNCDFEKNKFNIESAELQSASYIVSDITTPASVSSDTLKIDSLKYSIGDIYKKSTATLVIAKKVNLKSALSEQSISLSDVPAKALVEKYLSNAPYGARIYYYCTPNGLDVTYKIKIKLNFNVKYTETTP
jgi:hypothetical protein